jgi:hypothetical protein
VLRAGSWACKHRAAAALPVPNRAASPCRVAPAERPARGHSAAKKWAEKAWSPPPVPVVLLRCPPRSLTEESARTAPLLGFQAALEVAGRGLAYPDLAIICDGLDVQR